MSFNKKTAVVFSHIGLFDSPESIKPILFNFFNDKKVSILPFFIRFFIAKFLAKKYSKKLTKNYLEINSKDSCKDIFLNLSYSLERELSFFGDYKIFVTMKYCRPFAKDVIKEIEKYNPKNLILLSSIPQYSKANVFFEEFEKLPQFASAKKFHFFYDNKNFINSICLSIEKTILANYKNFHKFGFLFVAVGISQHQIDLGDEYISQINSTSNSILDKMSEIFVVPKDEIYHINCYQPKFGVKQYQTPTLKQAIKKLSLDDKIPVIVPISSINESFETLFDLDINYKNYAKKFGLKEYLRVQTANYDGNFIQKLAKNIHFNRS